MDLESHGWPPGPSHTRIGEFGWHLVAEDGLLDFARIVQLGWTKGYTDLRQNPERKCYLIKPDDFTITSDATKFHKITNAEAVEYGRPLPDVLDEFMADVMAECKSTGQVCAHHLEFDAGIILRELRRVGREDLAAEWALIAKAGHCTMNRDLGGWGLPQVSKSSQRSEIEKAFLSMKTVAEALQVPDHAKLLAQHHNAGADSEVVFQIFAAVLRRTGCAVSGRLEL